MRISIFGLGYVGVVSGACLARLGHEIIGVDVNAEKIGMINAGTSPIVEAGIGALVESAVAAGTLRATTDADAAVAASEVSFVSVGTPSAANGAISLAAIEAATDEIGTSIRRKDAPHAVVYRSTVIPGTTDSRLIPQLTETSGRSLGDGIEVCFNPEFLREGSSIADFDSPPYTIAGVGSDEAYRILEEIYAPVDAPLLRCDFRVAESVKYMSNAFHAVKVCFANEMGALLATMGMDARDAAAIFCRDEILNISPAYLRPGFAFGGSCLPKDLRAILHMAKDRDLALPMLDHVLDSNARHIDRAFDMIAAGGRRRVALFGLSFKGGTDDLRESPIVSLAEKLIGKGFELKIYDSNVQMARLIGANRAFIEREIPHIDRLLRPSPAETLTGAEIIVIGHAGEDEVAAIGAHARTLARDAQIVDLQGIDALRDLEGSAYQGICW